MTVVRPVGVVPTLRFYSGPMAAGKSELCRSHALELTARGAAVWCVTKLDRSGGSEITTHSGLRHPALALDDHGSVAELVAGEPAGVLLCDEAQFYTPGQVDELVDLVDDGGWHVRCYGLLRDFTGALFPGSQRLVEVADELVGVGPPSCWCGEAATQTARLVDGEVVRDGDQVVVAGVAEGSVVRYEPMCRWHWRRGEVLCHEAV